MVGRVCGGFSHELAFKQWLMMLRVCYLLPNHKLWVNIFISQKLTSIWRPRSPFPCSVNLPLTEGDLLSCLGMYPHAITLYLPPLPSGWKWTSATTLEKVMHTGRIHLSCLFPLRSSDWKKKPQTTKKAPFGIVISNSQAAYMQELQSVLQSASVCWEFSVPTSFLQGV